MAVQETLLSLVLVVSVAILVLISVLVWSQRGDPAVDTDQLSTALHRTMDETNLTGNLARIEGHARELNAVHRDLDALLRNPQQRGTFGEIQLELLLEEHLSPDLYDVRSRVVDGKIPDAAIQSTAGVICIDAKFSLENYRRLVDATGDDRDTAANAFARDVRDRLDEIESKYVAPEDGTAPFAFGFIPAESIYYHLVTEEYELLQEYTRRGVQVVSPLTLGHKLELIKAGVATQRLSEEAREIRDDLARLESRFEDLQSTWDTFYEHVRNAHNRARDVDEAYGRLVDEFDRIKQRGETVTDE